MLTYRYRFAPYGPDDFAEVTISGGRRKALVALHKNFPDKSGWKFDRSISPTGLVRS